METRILSLEHVSDYQNLPGTAENLHWMDVVTLDFSIFNEPGGKQKLPRDLKHAIHNIGFFHILNFGLSQAEISRQFSLASSIFTLPQTLKDQFIDRKSIPALGYKPAGERTMTAGIKDCVEIYDDPKYNLFFNDYVRPPPCFKEKEYTERFCKHLHSQVLHRLLILTAIIMGMDDEEALAKLHTFDALSDCRMRYMIQHPRTAEGLKVLEQADDGEDDIIYRHTDFGTDTLLFSQPVAALQARAKEGK
jgi:isopenicillin N synthase-like dioxygenase